MHSTIPYSLKLMEVEFTTSLTRAWGHMLRVPHSLGDPSDIHGSSVRRSVAARIPSQVEAQQKHLQAASAGYLAGRAPTLDTAYRVTKQDTLTVLPRKNPHLKSTASSYLGPKTLNASHTCSVTVLHRRHLASGMKRGEVLKQHSTLKT